MKILDTQSATLTTAEVLAHLQSNAPRKPPSAPPNLRNFTPKPDLRDHNTVVKEFKDYVERICPYLYAYPTLTPPQATTGITTTTGENVTTDTNEASSAPPPPPSETTELDIAIRNLITRLKPYNLTKAEVLMIANLGVGVEPPPPAGEGTQLPDGEPGANNVPDGNQDVAMQDGDEDGEGEEGMEERSIEETARVVLDLLIEVREERFTEDDINEIIRITQECLTGRGAEGDEMET